MTISVSDLSSLKFNLSVSSSWAHSVPTVMEWQNNFSATELFWKLVPSALTWASRTGTWRVVSESQKLFLLVLLIHDVSQRMLSCVFSTHHEMKFYHFHRIMQQVFLLTRLESAADEGKLNGRGCGNIWQWNGMEKLFVRFFNPGDVSLHCWSPFWDWLTVLSRENFHSGENHSESFQKLFKELFRAFREIFLISNILNFVTSSGNSLHSNSTFLLSFFPENLQYLRLGDNDLHQIPSESLKPLHRLRHLDLRSNNISYIAEDAFVGFGDSITFLNLQKNEWVEN